MTRRFTDLRIIRQAPTLGEAVAGWIGLLLGILLVVLVGYLIGLS